MNKQILFDKAAVHMLNQGVRSRNGMGQCKYRHGGLACGIGALIKDEHYNPRFEGDRATSPMVLDAIAKSFDVTADDLEVIPGMPRMLNVIQQVHDRNEPAKWPDSLRTAARLFRLNEDAIDAWERSLAQA